MSWRQHTSFFIQIEVVIANGLNCCQLYVSSVHAPGQQRIYCVLVAVICGDSLTQ